LLACLHRCSRGSLRSASRSINTSSRGGHSHPCTTLDRISSVHSEGALQVAKYADFAPDKLVNCAKRVFLLCEAGSILQFL
jgi:hypothetical protein